MSATIEVDGSQATVTNMKWRSESKPLQMALDAFMSTYEWGGSDPNPDYTVAQKAAARLGGRVIQYDKLEFDPSVEY